MEIPTIAIIGAGAAGYFAAINCAEELKGLSAQARVLLIESAGVGLRKVKISGGGRCNVTHHEFNIPAFCEHYPRGKRELRSPFHTFQARDTVEWFEKRGVKLKVEDDGRMFPVTNKSDTIIDCLIKEAKRLNIEVMLRHKVEEVQLIDEKYLVKFSQDRELNADALVMATGSDPKGRALIASLGHTITDLAPSLFTFKIEDKILSNLAGTSFETATVQAKFPKKKYTTTGPMLITHWGLSGPVVLKMSSFAAREMKACSYQCEVRVNFTPFTKEGQWLTYFEKLLKEGGKALLKNTVPYFLTKKFWHNFLLTCAIGEEKKCNELSLKHKNKIIQDLFSKSLHLNGQSRFKEEFVECGGVSLKEINFKTMESKLLSNLYFAGEVLDVDGVTGGFNFQNAWTTGYLAGRNLAQKFI